MCVKSLLNKAVSGEIKAPGSKSYSQRALAANLLCKLGGQHTQTIENLDNSNDTRAATLACQALSERKSEIDIGESGLATRLFTPIAAALGRPIAISGNGSLLNRPMDFMKDTLKQMNVQYHSNNGYLPITVQGPIQGRYIEVDGTHGSQFISGLLFALPLAKDDSVLKVNNPTSKPYIDMTIDVLDKFGIEVENIDYQEFRVHGRQEYKACKYSVEGDWSGASCLLVAGATATGTGQVVVGNLNNESLQADRAIVDILECAGADLKWEGDKLRVRRGRDMRGFEADATDCPDLFPALAVLAAGCEGESLIRGTERLKHKESDRGVALQTEFAKAGVNIDLSEPNVMRIRGVRDVKAANYESWGDHRIAMAVAVLAARAQGESTLTGAESVNKSYPEFWDHLEMLQK